MSTVISLNVLQRYCRFFLKISSLHQKQTKCIMRKRTWPSFLQDYPQSINCILKPEILNNSQIHPSPSIIQTKATATISSSLMPLLKLASPSTPLNPSSLYFHQFPTLRTWPGPRLYLRVLQWLPLNTKVLVQCHRAALPGKLAQSPWYMTSLLTPQNTTPAASSFLPCWALCLSLSRRVLKAISSIMLPRRIKQTFPQVIKPYTKNL